MEYIANLKNKKTVADKKNYCYFTQCFFLFSVQSGLFKKWRQNATMELVLTKLHRKYHKPGANGN